MEEIEIGALSELQRGDSDGDALIRRCTSMVIYQYFYSYSNDPFFELMQVQGTHLQVVRDLSFLSCYP